MGCTSSIPLAAAASPVAAPHVQALAKLFVPISGTPQLPSALSTEEAARVEELKEEIG